MGVNLLRNARVFFTTNVNADTGKITTASGNTTTTVCEIQVLSGFSFSQATTAETVTLNEAGAKPVRGQRSFNTALNPVDFSFSTYLRPTDSNDSTTGGYVTAEERVLWNAMFSDKAIGTTGAAWQEYGATSATAFTISTAGTGYSVAGTYYSVPLVYVSGGTPATAPTEVPVADITVSGGAVTAITIVTPGTGVSSGQIFTADKTNLGLASSATPTAFQVTVSTVSATSSASPAKVVTDYSQVHQLQKFGMIIVFDDTTYFIENCTLDTATIDFGLDAIATVAWTGKATTLTSPTTTVAINDSTNALSGGVTGNFKSKITTAPYIANKLSTMTLRAGINGEGSTVNSVAYGPYTVALTGGNITISNNVNYLTPANLGTVNKPCTYFTGTRSITGNVTAYLRGGTGANYTAKLLSDLLTKSVSDVDPEHELVIALGGSTNSTRVELDISAAVLQIPTISTDQVISTTINFTAQGYTPVSGASTTNSTDSGVDKFEITNSNELEIRYYAPIA